MRLVAIELTLFSLLLLTLGLFLFIAGGHFIQVACLKLGCAEFSGKSREFFGWFIFLIFSIVTFNIFYIFAPGRSCRNKYWAGRGTFIGVLLWLIVSFGLKIYLHFFSTYSVSYGSIGGVIVLLLWFYLSGIAILVGGEVNSTQYRKTHSRKADVERSSLSVGFLR